VKREKLEQRSIVLDLARKGLRPLAVDRDIVIILGREAVSDSSVNRSATPCYPRPSRRIFAEAGMPAG
jgi:hypothetical protein